MKTRLFTLVMGLLLLANAPADPQDAQAVLPQPSRFRHPGRRGLAVAGVLAMVVLGVAMLAVGLPPVVMQARMVPRGRGGFARSITPDMVGLDDPEQAFKTHWGAHKFPTRSLGPGELVTVPIQEVFAQKTVRDKYAGWARKGIQKAREFQAKAMDKPAVEASTPVIFDPEVLDIIRSDGPLLARVPEEGQQGFKAVVNRIDSREAPIGFVTEADAMNLTDNTESDVGFAKVEKDMKLWVDLVKISDFAKLGMEHYHSVRDTTLGGRLGEHAQAWERALLYGDPAQATGTGGHGSANAVDGLEKVITAANNRVDKSAVDLSGTHALLKDIKSEIKKMLQSKTLAISKGDLELWTSHTLFDDLENELEVGRRIVTDPNSVNFGYETITISGVPVFASHNVASHTDGAFTTGSEGDVFIVNRRELRIRSLAPLSTVPLGRRGLAEEVALFRFSSVVCRANGKLMRYLDAYAV